MEEHVMIQQQKRETATYAHVRNIQIDIELILLGNMISYSDYDKWRISLYSIHFSIVAVTYPDITFTGGDAYDGMNPSGTYSGSPSSFSVPNALKIEAEILKEYDCSDHFFVLAASSSYRPWSWSSQSNTIKVVWDCNTANLYGPTTSRSQTSSSRTIHRVTVIYSRSNIKFTTDVDSVNWKHRYS